MSRELDTSNWNEVYLGDIVEITHGWAFKSKFFSEDLSGKPIIVNIGNFQYTGGFRFESTTIKEYRDAYPEEYDLSPGDILLVMTCQTPGGEILGIPARIPDDGRTYLHNQRLGKVVIKDESVVDRDFIYWLFLWSELNQELCSTATGTKILHTAPTRIEAFQFRLPPIEEQRAIASILGALDDKIELNRRTNATLESLARAIFKSWFVDFDPVKINAGQMPASSAISTAHDLNVLDLFPATFQDSELGPIPEGWSVERFADHISVTRGLSYKGVGLADAGVPMHNLNSIYEGGGYKHKGIKYYTGEYRDRHVVVPGDLIATNTEQGFEHRLIGCAALVPKRYGETGIYSHHIYRVRMEDETALSPHYMLQLINSSRWHSWIAGFSNGTTINMLPTDALEMPLLVVPPAGLVQHFTQLASTIADEIEDSILEGESLAVTRDALLPRLLSGELPVDALLTEK